MDNEEIICTCFDLKVQDIKDAINNGAKSYDDVVEATQVGTACGVCVDNVKALVNDLLEK